MLYHIFLDPTTGIVEQVIRFSNHKVLEHMTNITRQSFMTPNNLCQMLTLTEEDIPNDIKGIIEKRPILFVYNKTDNKFLRRPAILLTLDKGIDQNKVPTNKNIVIHVKYYNPDYLDYKRKFEKLKVKDRAGFVYVPELITLEDNDETSFIVKSQVPGKSSIRVKDDQYLCYFEPLDLRFIPSAPTKQR